MSATLYARQNHPSALEFGRAFRRRYAIARRWRAVRMGTGVVLGTVGVLLALAEPSTGEYVSALAAAWLVFGRTVLGAYEQRRRSEGALAQELFDTEVLNLPWSSSAVGTRPVPEDVRNWARRQTNDGVRDWYADTGSAQHPVDALICQRSIITWARQDHAVYAQILRWLGGAMFVLTIVVGLILDLTMGEYLLRLGLPVLPAVLDVLDIAKANADVAEAKLRLEEQATSLLEHAQATGTPPTVADCRQLQDGIYATRLLPGIPSWMYRITRNDRQENMDEVVRGQVALLPPALR